MRLSHFESLGPICPNCRDVNSSKSFPLSLQTILLQYESQIVEGVLRCSNPNCLSEFPIIDGVPIILPRLRAYLSENLLHVMARTDLAPTIDSILGDCCSQGSLFDSMRQHLSCYVWDHYADQDPMEIDPQACGSVVRLLEQGVALGASSPTLAKQSPLPILDVGCGPGRTSIAIAQSSSQLTLGIDLNFSMLRLASTMLRTGRIAYARRRVGLVYDHRAFAVHLDGLDQVDFWACDALALPFADHSFGGCIAMNILDSVRSPLELLQSIGRSLASDGNAILACPYDWSSNVTPVESWIGGHSQRGPDAGASEPMLRRWMSPGEDGAPSVTGLQWVSEMERAEWTIRIHDRNTMTYQTHVVVARRSN